jgi:hypothetical protein
VNGKDSNGGHTDNATNGTWDLCSTLVFRFLIVVKCWWHHYWSRKERDAVCIVPVPCFSSNPMFV